MFIFNVCFIHFIRLVQRPWVVYYKMDLCQKSKRKCYLIIHKESSHTLRKMPKNKQNNSLHILLLCQFTICQQKYESTFLTIIKSWWRKNAFLSFCYRHWIPKSYFVALHYLNSSSEECSCVSNEIFYSIHIINIVLYMCWRYYCNQLI